MMLYKTPFTTHPKAGLVVRAIISPGNFPEANFSFRQHAVLLKTDELILKISCLASQKSIIAVLTKKPCLAKEHNTKHVKTSVLNDTRKLNAMSK